MLLRKIKNQIFKKVKILFLIFLFSLITFGIIFAFYKLFLPKNPPVSPLAKGRLQNQNNLEQLLKKNKIEFSKISIATDSSYLVILKDNEEINLSKERDLQTQISSLQLILSRLTIEGKKFKKIDFRFDKPIIVF